MGINCEIKNTEDKEYYKPCSCDEWKEGMAQLDGFTMLAYTHEMHYTGKQFRYCPWCGEKLQSI
jgi:hypothetical protein